MEDQVISTYRHVINSFSKDIEGIEYYVGKEKLDDDRIVMVSVKAEVV